MSRVLRLRITDTEDGQFWQQYRRWIAWEEGVGVWRQENNYSNSSDGRR